MEKHLIESYYKWVSSKLYPFLLLHAGPEIMKAYLVTSKELKSDFSYNHLHRKYYQVDENTKKKVYDYIMAMAQLCQKM